MNQSKALAFWLLSQVAWVTDAELRRMQMALSITGGQTANAYGKPLPSYSCASTIADVPADLSAVPVVFQKTISQPQDLALHEVLAGRPYIVVLADPDQVVLADVQEGAGHESDETIVDAPCDIYMPMPDGSEIALEVDDPVQGDRRMIDIGEGDLIAQSNRVNPAWFDPSSPPGTLLDAMGLCTEPLVVRPGGYAMIQNPDGSYRQIGQGPAAYKKQAAFRHGRRLAAMHNRALRIALA